jgi:hypothetical protein
MKAVCCILASDFSSVLCYFLSFYPKNLFFAVVRSLRLSAILSEPAVWRVGGEKSFLNNGFTAQSTTTPGLRSDKRRLRGR